MNTQEKFDSDYIIEGVAFRIVRYVPGVAENVEYYNGVVMDGNKKRIAWSKVPEYSYRMHSLYSASEVLLEAAFLEPYGNYKIQVWKPF